MVDKPKAELTEEMMLFNGLWKGGYFAGDPLDPVGKCDYGDMGYISVHHATYQVCIRPYIKPDTTVLEIGPGRGAWTKTMLDAKEIWCVDVLSAEHNRFWEYVGHEYKKKIRYLQVDDFSCNDLPDNYFDFLFSFGTFCHITWDSQREYYSNLYRKMRAGSTAMIMFADFDKFNNAISRTKRLRVRGINGNIFVSSFRDMIAYTYKYFKNRPSRVKKSRLLDKSDTTPEPGKWYHAGIRETREFLESLGWEVVNPDMGINHRDPIIHFRKKE